MNKIIYLIEQPLDQRNYDRFGIQSWLDWGWGVQVWDLTAVAHPLVWNDFIESGQELRSFDGYFPIASHSQLARHYSALREPAYYIDLTGENLHSVRVKIRLAILGVRRIECISGAIPTLADAEKPGVLRTLRKIFSTRIINALVRRGSVPFIRPALLVVTGEESIPIKRGRTKIILAHNLDYDIYLKLKRTPSPPSGTYAVFVDQNICFHPEYIYDNTACYTSPEEYFPALRRGLRKISVELNVPFKVAAHPRLPRQRKYLEYFGGIPVEYDKTAELISNSLFVVCHYTTAIQYAVLFKKPIIFTTTNDLAASFVGAYLAKFASSFGKTAINLNGDLEQVDWFAELRVDLSRYAEYRRKYIKADGSPEIPYWEIVIEYIANAYGSVSSELPADRILGAGDFRVRR